jgi:hypothetical protein
MGRRPGAQPLVCFTAWLVLPGVLLAGAAPQARTPAGTAPQPRPAWRQYLDNPAFRWKCDRLAHFEFCYSGNLSPLAAAGMERDAERTLAEELRLAGASEFQPRVHLFVVESYERLQQLMGYYAAGGSQPTEHTVCFVAGHPEALTHELNHEVMRYLWGGSEDWIAEGLAAYVSEPGEVDNRFRQLLNAGKAVPINWLVNPGWTASMGFPSTVIYPELGSFVKYLKTTYGLGCLRQLWRGGSAAIPRVLGKSLGRIEQDWRGSLAGR